MHPLSLEQQIGPKMEYKSTLAFFNSLKSCFDAISLYPIGNPIVSQQFDNFIKTYQNFLDAEGKVSITFEHNYISFNERSLPPAISDHPSAKWLSIQCLDRKIQTLMFETGITAQDLDRFLELLRMRIEEFPTFETASRILFRRNVQRISINPVATDQTFSTLSNPFTKFQAPDRQDQEANMEPDLVPAYAFMHGPKDVSHEVPEDAIIKKEIEPEQTQQVQLFISHDEIGTLRNTMLEFIAKDRLKKVAESLNMMRNDLASKDRVVRELAFSSYYVVIEVLIEQRQKKALQAILKSIPADLGACKEADLYKIHLESLMKVIRFYRDQQIWNGLAYGLNVLAHQNLVREPEIHKLVEKELEEFLSLSILERLINNPTPDLQPMLKSLFSKHAIGILNPLLKGLFASQNRNTRKKLLEVLAQMGAVIYPILLQQLEKAIFEDAPWYVKRNLLFLLSARPPVDLAPLLSSLLKDPHPRLNELVYKCVFAINDARAYETGKRLLMTADPKRYPKLFSYLVHGKNPAFGKVLVDMFKKKDLPDEIKLELLNVIGRLDSPETISWLDSILRKSSLFPSKSETMIREGAAKALAGSEHDEARGLLTKYVKDKNERVRAVAKKALHA